jgi:hypothetical protein
MCTLEGTWFEIADVHIHVNHLLTVCICDDC